MARSLPREALAAMEHVADGTTRFMKTVELLNRGHRVHFDPLTEVRDDLDRAGRLLETARQKTDAVRDYADKMMRATDDAGYVSKAQLKPRKAAA
jgi:hypothetical protein